MSSMSKGDGIDGRARRWSYAGRLEARLWILTFCNRCRAPRTCLPACLAKHGPWKATCSLLLPGTPCFARDLSQTGICLGLEAGNLGIISSKQYRVV